MRSLLTLTLLVPLAGCAAVLGSKQKDFNLDSTPPAADVYLNGNRLGRTPVRVKLSNQATHTFVFRKEGYADATCTLNRGTGAGWVILDVLTGLVPIVIDAATNSWSQTKGDSCAQSLEPLSTAAATPAPSPAAVRDPVKVPSEAPAPAKAPSEETPVDQMEPPPERVAQNGVDTTSEPAAQHEPVQEPAARAELVDDAPEGANWVANAATRTYYRVGCPVTMSIPRADRLYYRNESGLRTAGFRYSDECSAPSAQPLASVPPDTAAPTQLVPETSSTKTSRHSRSGFWFNGGLGWGSLGCQNNCDDRVGGLSGGLALGGTLSQKVVLGVGSNGWYKSENGVTLSVGTLTALIRFYPSSTGGFFLVGGLGVGSIRAEISDFGSDTETGGGALLGLGYDIRIGNNVSLTPFWNGFAIKTSDDDANVGQIGLSVTAH